MKTQTKTQTDTLCGRDKSRLFNISGVVPLLVALLALALAGCSGGSSGGNGPDTDRETQQESRDDAGTGDDTSPDSSSPDDTSPGGGREEPEPDGSSSEVSYPQGPREFQAVASTDSARFSWKAVNGAEGYYLYIGEDPRLTPENYTSYGGTRVNVDTPPHIERSLEPGKTYYAMVTAHKGGVDGKPSRRFKVELIQSRPGQRITRISMGHDGYELPKSNATWELSVSADGRFVAFASGSDQVVAADSNGVKDVFVLDLETGETTLVSVNSSGEPGNGHSQRPSISGDGRFVAFQSQASNLVANDTNNSEDVFLHDRDTGETTRISVASDGTQGNGRSDNPAISADGRYIAFRSEAHNLVPDDTNSGPDIFLYQRSDGSVIRVSLSSNGEEGRKRSGVAGALFGAPAISGDGGLVVFRSLAYNLHPDGGANDPDILVRDWRAGRTELASVNNEGGQLFGDILSNPDISADGNYVVFQANHGNLFDDYKGFNGQGLDILLRDRAAGETALIPPERIPSRQYLPSAEPSISGDGRYVVFRAMRKKLVEGGNQRHDIFLFDRQTGETTLISKPEGDEYADGWSTRPVISADGGTIVFQSRAGNLVTGDNNMSWDVFVYRRPSGSE